LLLVAATVCLRSTPEIPAGLDYHRRSMASSSLRPLHLGELIDRSVRLWRTHLWPLVRTMLPFALTAHLLAVIANSLIATDYEALIEAGAIGELLSSLAGGFGLFFLGSCISWFGQLVVARELLPRVTGREVVAEKGRALAMRSTQQLLLLLGVFALGSLAIMAPTMLLLVPIGMLTRSSGFSLPIVPLVLVMILGFLLWVAFALWWMLRSSMALPVVAAERAGTWTLFKRGGALLRGRVGPGFLGRSQVRAAIVFTVVSILGTITQFVAAIPRFALEGVYFEDGGGPVQIPWLWRIPAELMVAGGQALFGPLVVAGCVLFYVDQRVRREGLDLELALERIP